MSYQILYNPYTGKIQRVDLSQPNAQQQLVSYYQTGWTAATAQQAQQVQTEPVLSAPATPTSPAPYVWEPPDISTLKTGLKEGTVTVSKVSPTVPTTPPVPAETPSLLAPFTSDGSIDLVAVAASKNTAAINEAYHLYGDEMSTAIVAAKDPATTEQYMKVGPATKKNLRIVTPVSLSEWNAALARDDIDYLLKHYPESKGVSAASAAKLGPGLLGRYAFTQPTVAEKASSISRNVTGALVNMVPFSQYFLPGRLEEYKKRGALGYTELGIQTLLDISIVGSVIGTLSKVATGVIRKTAYGQVAALGGEKAVGSLIKEAESKVAETAVELNTLRVKVKTAQNALQKAIAASSPDILLRREALDLAQSDLKLYSAAENSARLAQARRNVSTLQELLTKARSNPNALNIATKAFKATEASASVNATIAEKTFKLYGLAEGGYTISQWNSLSGMQRAMGLTMSALALGIPTTVVGRLKSGGEVVFSPGRIPHRSIAVPESYLPGKAGMPKTTVRGLAKEEQVEAMEISDEALRLLWEGKGKVHILWPIRRGNKIVYAPRSQFQKVVPQSMISATPVGEVFDKPIYAVITVREPAQYFSAWGFPAFTKSSAAGVKGAEPAYLVLFSENIQKLPKSVRNLKDPVAIRQGIEELFATGKAKPGTYPGYKLYKETKEPEFTVPTGTEIGRVEGGVNLWTRTSPFGPKVEIQPHFIMAEEGARRTGFTAKEALLLKEQGVPAEVLHYWEKAQFWKGGIAGETSKFRGLQRRLDKLLRDEDKAYQELSVIENREITKTNERLINQKRGQLAATISEREALESELRFERALRSIESDAELRRLVSEVSRHRNIRNILRAVESEAIEDIRTAPAIFRQLEIDRTLARERISPEPPRVERATRTEEPQRTDITPRTESVDMRTAITRVDEPVRDGRVDVPLRAERPPDRIDEPPRTERPPETDIPPTTQKKKGISSDSDISIEHVEGIPSDPGIIEYNMGIVGVAIYPPYRLGPEDVTFVRLEKIQTGRGSEQQTLRVRKGKAPKKVVLRHGRKRTTIYNGRRLENSMLRGQRGPGLLTPSGRIIRQRRGSVL